MSHFQTPIDLVGGNVIEKAAVAVWIPARRSPMPPGRLQQCESTQHIGPGEGERVGNRPVHMRLGSQMYDAVHPLLFQKGGYAAEIADVHLHETIVRPVRDIIEVGEIPGVCQFVDIDNPAIRIFADKKPDYVRADEACPAGDEDGTSHCQYRLTL